MRNVLKLAAIYTGVYFLFLMAYWICFVTIAIFWKPLVTFFVIIFAWFGIEYFIQYRRRAHALGKFGLKPSGNDAQDRAAFTNALFNR